MKEQLVNTVLRDPRYLAQVLRDHVAALTREVSGTAIRSVSVARREIEAILSTDQTDRAGDRIEQEGLEAQGDVPMLYGHRSDDPHCLIGRWVRTTRVTLPSGVKATVGHGIFATEDENPLASQCLKLAEAGILTGVSIGFNPIASRWPDDTERARLGMPQHGRIFTKGDLVEASLVACPANPGATIQALKSLPAAARAAAAVLGLLPHVAEAAPAVDPDWINRAPVDPWLVVDSVNDLACLVANLAARVEALENPTPGIAPDEHVGKDAQQILSDVALLTRANQDPFVRELAREHLRRMS